MCNISMEMELRSIKKYNEVISVYAKSTYKRIHVSDNEILQSLCNSNTSTSTSVICKGSRHHADAIGALIKLPWCKSAV